MKISRDFTKYVHFVLDQLMPPILRDQKWIMHPLLKLTLKDKAQDFISFKDQSYGISDKDFAGYYQRTYGILDRETDLNQGCIDTILQEHISGEILEAGCGNGYLANMLDHTFGNVTALDINISKKTRKDYKNITFIDGAVENVKLKDNSFDTVICTHTLEHVLDLQKSISELRRVAKRKLIIVVPCQRPYKYTFDLHLHFFPYDFSVLHALKPPHEAKYTLKKISGDWYYTEEYNA